MSDTAEPIAEATPITYPDGEYAIVELCGSNMERTALMLHAVEIRLMEMRHAAVRQQVSELSKGQAK